MFRYALPMCSSLGIYLLPLYGCYILPITPLLCVPLLKRFVLPGYTSTCINLLLLLSRQCFTLSSCSSACIYLLSLLGHQGISLSIISLTPCSISIFWIVCNWLPLVCHHSIWTSRDIIHLFTTCIVYHIFQRWIELIPGGNIILCYWK
jgi:hypothetical protein